MYKYNKIRDLREDMERVTILYGVTLDYLSDREPRREPQESEKGTK